MQMTYLRSALAGVFLTITITGCAQNSARIDLTAYAPVIDVKGQGYDQADYARDLDECRALGVRVQAQYEEQQKKEL